MLLTKTLLVTTVAATAVAGAAVLTAGAAVAEPAIAGTYNTVSPTRVLDTRAGTGAPKAEVKAHGTVTFNAASPIKTKLVSAESLTITAVAPAAAGYLVAYTGGTTKPATSSVNFAQGTSAANAAFVPYGASGTVTIYNGSSKAVDVVADLSGYWTGGSVADDTDGSYNPVASSRLVDTRKPPAPARTPANDAPVAVPAGGSLSVAAGGKGGVPSTNVSAVVVNIAVPDPTAAGYVTATADPDDQQGAATRTSDVAFGAGKTFSDQVVVPVDPDAGTFSVYNGSAKPVNLVIDLVGYFSGGAPSDDGAFVSDTPYRNSDTRTGATPAAHSTTKVAVVPGSSPQLFKAVVATITDTNAKQLGYLTAWSGSGARPATSSLNHAANQAMSVTAIVPLNADGSISIYNGSTGSVDLVVDVHGFMLNDVSGDTPAQVQARIHSALNHARSNAAKRLSS